MAERIVTQMIYWSDEVTETTYTNGEHDGLFSVYAEDAKTKQITWMTIRIDKTKHKIEYRDETENEIYVDILPIE